MRKMLTWISCIVLPYKEKKNIPGILKNMQEIYTNLQDAHHGSEYRIRSSLG